MLNDRTITVQMFLCCFLLLLLLRYTCSEFKSNVESRIETRCSSMWHYWCSCCYLLFCS